MAFTGFPAAAVDFYARLEADNSKEFWAANKTVYDTQVKGPMEALIAELDERFRPMHIFRPHRDVRFSKDKTPYKTQIGAVGEGEGGAMHYVALGSDGLMVASGYYMMSNDQLARFRAAIDAEATGAELISIMAALSKSKHPVVNGGGDPLKSAPRGYAKDHPRIELLRWKGIIVSHQLGIPKWLSTKGARARIEALWDAAEPLNAWLDAHVGPSLEAPDERWVR